MLEGSGLEGGVGAICAQEECSVAGKSVGGGQGKSMNEMAKGKRGHKVEETAQSAVQRLSASDLKCI